MRAVRLIPALSKAACNATRLSFGLSSSQTASLGPFRWISRMFSASPQTSAFGRNPSVSLHPNTSFHRISPSDATLSPQAEAAIQLHNKVKANKKKRGIRDVGSDEDFASGSSAITAPNSDPSRATAFSTAENYNFHALLPILQKRFVLLPFIADEVFHVRVADPAAVAMENSATYRLHHQINHNEKRHRGDNAHSPSASHHNPTHHESTSSSLSVDAKADDDFEPSVSSGDSRNVAPAAGQPPSDVEAFFFSDGTFVTWGASEDQIEQLREVADEVGIGKYNFTESEWFDYYVDMSQYVALSDLDRLYAPSGISADTIIIGYDLPPHQSMLAFSSGLARSAKLASLENLLDTHLDKNRHIPNVLLLGKRIPMGRAAVLRSLGELFSLRGHLNLHSELLDSPDFCWSSSRMEACFERISRNLDVRPRIAVFNKKLDYANELAEVLRNHLHEQHSLKLEWCIIILISVEILFSAIHYIEKWSDDKPGPEVSTAV
ncbi:hypothetical protein HDU97_002979 [Phlyctochytrium planicorne]|nr:hypothetical protein HDU97_002979 [Phlyctochytrium planicorne]